jgi:GMP synthase (glutamine-hydrolysing)
VPLIFGGPQSANDNESRSIGDRLGPCDPCATQKPYLESVSRTDYGNVISRERVYPQPQGHAEVDYYPIRPTDAGRKMCDDWPNQVYNGNRESFDLPSDQ